MKRARCHDCDVLEGEIHELSCDMERCPFCGRQLITCGCCYDFLKLRDYKRFSKTEGLSPDIYSNGLTDKLENEWLKILQEKGRIPYIQYPIVCCKCGQLWPELFNAPNEEWEKYVEPSMRDKVLCKECYNQIKKWVDEGVK